MLSLDTLLMLAVLSPRQREALVDTCLLGHRLEQVGSRMGVSPERVRQLANQARGRCAAYRDWWVL